MNCPTCGQKVPTNIREDVEAAKKHFFEKDTIFARRAELCRWPMANCNACEKRGGCGVSYNHHVGDCCLHCGNDEREKVAQS